MGFHQIVIIIAFIIMIFALIGVGMTLHKGSIVSSYPTYTNSCPDGWTPSADGCTMPDGASFTEADLTNYNDTYGIFEQNGKTIKFPPATTKCAKYNFSKHFGLTWDGISNYNQCQ